MASDLHSYQEQHVLCVLTHFQGESVCHEKLHRVGEVSPPRMLAIAINSAQLTLRRPSNFRGYIVD
jgi:hypothetical protein